MFAALIEKLGRRQDLTTEEAASAMAGMMEGRATAVQIAGFLIGLAMKGERPEEIVGLAQTMRGHAVKLEGEVPQGIFDTCGTGGDRSGTFNISSAAALVVAACGIPVAKHGNRCVSSRCGSADVFEALGVNTSASPAAVGRCLNEVGVAFLFAPAFHPAMRHAAPARQELAVRTAFNLLGPLTNPAGAARQLVGVPRPEHTELLAHALRLLGSERAWVVHGADGIDEISTSGYTKVSECHGGTVRTFYVHPCEFGLAKSTGASLQGGDAATNAAIIRDVLDGARGPARDIVLLNAGSALFIADRVPSVEAGIAEAAGAIDDGRAARTLARLIQTSTTGPAEGSTTGHL